MAPDELRNLGFAEDGGNCGSKDDASTTIDTVPAASTHKGK